MLEFVWTNSSEIHPDWTQSHCPKYEFQQEEYLLSLTLGNQKHLRFKVACDCELKFVVTVLQE